MDETLLKRKEIESMRADKELSELFYELLHWSKEKLREALDKQDWDSVRKVMERIEAEIGY